MALKPLLESQYQTFLMMQGLSISQNNLLFNSYGNNVASEIPGQLYYIHVINEHEYFYDKVNLEFNLPSPLCVFSGKPLFKFWDKFIINIFITKT